jgi:hypothetical protein
MILGARDCIDILRRLYVYVANMDICLGQVSDFGFTLCAIVKSSDRDQIIVIFK